MEIDGFLRRLSRQEALCRRVLGKLAQVFLHRCAHSRLGFAHLADYTRERLGLSARELEQMAAVAKALERLPQTAAAFEAGRLMWTRLRLIVSVASCETEATWLRLARTNDTALLETLVREELRKNGGAGAGTPGARAAPDQRDGLSPSDDQIDGEPRVRFRLRCPRHVRALWRRTLEFAGRMAGSRLSVWQAAEAIAAEGLSGRPAGGASAAADVPPRALPGYRVYGAPMGLARERGTWPSDPRARAVLDWSALREAIPEEIERLAAGAADLDAYELDERLRRAIRAMQRIDWQTGRLLCTLFDLHLYKEVGYHSSADYVRERTGLGLRKARSLVAIERKTRQIGPELTEAYKDGGISWLRAVTLLPILSKEYAGAWIERAAEVTHRRLADEVEWALEEQDRAAMARSGAPGAHPPPVGPPAPSLPVAPPPAGARLDIGRSHLPGVRVEPEGKAPAVHAAASFAGDAACSVETASAVSQPAACAAGEAVVPLDQVQSRAPADAPTDPVQSRSHTAGLADEQHETQWLRAVPLSAQIVFDGPASVVSLLESAMLAHRQAGEPLWKSFERLLTHVLAEWEGQPRHRDPIFERDGWRCTVPACSSRRNLHDHHIVFRSRGGDNERDNRVAVCAWHHLRAIHRGRVRAYGRAPDGVVWELGLRPGKPPLMKLLGDTYDKVC